jgi:hypothetical protein
MIKLYLLEHERVDDEGAECDECWCAECDERWCGVPGDDDDGCMQNQVNSSAYQRLSYHMTPVTTFFHHLINRAFTFFRTSVCTTKVQSATSVGVASQVTMTMIR